MHKLLWVCLCLQSAGSLAVTSGSSPYVATVTLWSSMMFSYSRKLFLSESPSGIFFKNSSTESAFFSFWIFLTLKLSPNSLTLNLFEVKSTLTFGEAISRMNVKNYSWFSFTKWSMLSRANKNFLVKRMILPFTFSISCWNSSWLSLKLW